MAVAIKRDARVGPRVRVPLLSKEERMGPRVDVVAVKDTFSLRTEVGAGVDAFVVLGKLRAGLTARTDGCSIGVHARC